MGQILNRSGWEPTIPEGQTAPTKRNCHGPLPAGVDENAYEKFRSVEDSLRHWVGNDTALAHELRAEGCNHDRTLFLLAAARPAVSENKQEGTVEKGEKAVEEAVVAEKTAGLVEMEEDPIMEDVEVEEHKKAEGSENEQMGEANKSKEND